MKSIIRTGDPTVLTSIQTHKPELLATEPQEVEKMMTPPITEEIIEAIMHINKLITLNEFERLEKEHLITQVKPAHLRTAFYDHFNNNDSSSDFSRISTPSRQQILNDSTTLFADPKNPSLSPWMIEVDIIIDSQPSDLTAIYNINTTSTTTKIDLYAVSTH